MHPARHRLDREGLAAGHAVNLEALRVACDDRADAFSLAELDRGYMGERDIQSIDLTLLVGGLPYLLRFQRPNASSRNSFEPDFEVNEVDIQRPDMTTREVLRLCINRLRRYMFQRLDSAQQHSAPIELNTETSSALARELSHL